MVTHKNLESSRTIQQLFVGKLAPNGYDGFDIIEVSGYFTIDLKVPAILCLVISNCKLFVHLYTYRGDTSVSKLQTSRDVTTY